MSPSLTPEWRKLPLTLSELCIDTTLRCGQSFRWRRADDEWFCALRGRIVALKQDATALHYKVTWPANSPKRVGQDDTEALLRHYFSLNLDLQSLYQEWSDADPNFRKRAPAFQGVRMLSQDSWEALVCFICSSNNNIARISQMVHKLCDNYGPLIGHVGDVPVHDFPGPNALADSKVEARLRDLGFGYRARYIATTANIVAHEKPTNWLETLRNPENPSFNASPKDTNPEATYKEAHEELIQLSGVGPKVADCVCLMGLGWGEAVPVDTHVWQIAQRDYKFGKVKTKTFTKAMYEGVGDLFRGLWGKHAGWAHSVLFTADLRSFAEQGAADKEVKIEEQVKIETEGDEKKVVSKKRKRTVTETGDSQTVVKTEVKTEVKLEELQKFPETSPKRRRTRSSMKR